MSTRWTLLYSLSARARSSHCVSVTSRGLLYLYGGELQPRIPVDSATVTTSKEATKGSVHAFDLTQQNVASNSWTTLIPSALSPDLTPEARVGATTVWDEATQSLYLWGGRGGVDMSPLSGTQTGVWKAQLPTGIFSDMPIRWDRITATNENEAPAPRSYHTAVSAQGKMYVHAGCPTAGRLGSLHSFDLATKTWHSLADAPEPARGGTNLAVVTLRDDDGPEIIRFGGFAGYELPSKPSLDIYSIASDTWRTIEPREDRTHGYPGPRSVHGLIPLTSKRNPQAIAVLWHGERDASILGHAGAGMFWDDAWVLEKSEDDGGLSWRYLEPGSHAAKPEGRGWFPGASYVNELGETQVIMFGGLLGSNERSGELWTMDIDW
ncbi:galactose oxidase [Hygrophoropsis aurantiaca]|uniref:Galactose oxidase n=1 Tax=Hygrophoropsis aurantiaca TaxID=72124 RepID=A0ACB8AJK7_9AGAM|nr:galactose oxidase [Hygrophoropsis aurantiaca]